MQVKQARQWGEAQINSDTARVDAEWLLAHALSVERSYLYSHPEVELNTQQLAVYQDLVERREQGEPVAYLLGQWEFWSLPLTVNNNVLIPRPETESLVETLLALLDTSPKHVLDLGVGSGAITLALASERPRWQLLGTDCDVQVVALARANAEQLGLTNLTFNCGSWFEAVEGSFDAIVSNPPYIAPGDPHLAEGDVRFEPRKALIAAQEGLADIRHIIQYAPRYLNAGGWLLLEHGYDQAAAVQQLMTERGFIEVRSVIDFNGHQRIALGRYVDDVAE